MILTDEQRARLREHLENLIDYDEADGNDEEIPGFRWALAMLTDEAELHRRVGAAVMGVLSDFGWDHAVLRADVSSDRLADTVEGCVLLAVERAIRPDDFVPSDAEKALRGAE